MNKNIFFCGKAGNFIKTLQKPPLCKDERFARLSPLAQQQYLEAYQNLRHNTKIATICVLGNASVIGAYAGFLEQSVCLGVFAGVSSAVFLPLCALPVLVMDYMDYKEAEKWCKGQIKNVRLEKEGMEK